MKADKIVSVIASEIEPLAAAGKGEEAQTRLKTSIAKVESSGQSNSVKRMTVNKLKALGIKVASAKTTENREQSIAAADAVELKERLDVLERKLETAQESFATLIRTIEGFSEFSGDLTSERDSETMAATLKEKVKSGKVSKTKVDNMVKAKAEHVGILREVEILQTESVKLSPVQKGRLASLRATTKTALALLKDVIP